MTLRFAAAAALLGALLPFGPPPVWAVAPSSAPPADTTQPRLRVFFFSDAHSRPSAVATLVEAANRERPDVVLEGGDLVHDGTEPEFRQALEQRARLEPRWFAVRGNHDARLRGRFAGAPPGFDSFRAVTLQGYRLILLDNQDERLSNQQFARLEAELRAHGGERTILVMHVPPTLSRTPPLVRLRHLLPFRLASPVMRDAGEVERFTALMERYGVLAVLTGHAHFPDLQVRGGVHYIVAGALGGHTPGLRTAHEYVDLTFVGGDVTIDRVRIAEPAGDPVRLLARAFRFYAELNRFNHETLGWRYAPSVSVQVTSGLERFEAYDRSVPALFGALVFERLLDEAGRRAFSGELAVSAGSGVLAAQLAADYRLRPIGDFNRNVFAFGGPALNAGILASTPTVGVGARFGAGAEWRHLTLEVGRTLATNHRATRFTLGYRF